MSKSSTEIDTGAAVGKSFVQRLVTRFARWRERRRWPVTEQVHWMRTHLINDSQWLSGDPKAAALCERYLKMLTEDWQKVSVENISDFRQRIGADPHRGG
jgi:hypothetical protein